MTKREWKRIVWERLASTAVADVDCWDFFADYPDATDEDNQRVNQVSYEIAATIRKVHVKKEGRARK